MGRIYIDGDSARFTRKDITLVDVELSDGTTFEKLEPRRLFPVSDQNRYIALLDENGTEQAIIRDICLYHHERIDGSGYEGKTDIPLYVQLVSVCDVFDALHSDRIYRRGYSVEKSLGMIKDRACGGFSETVVGFLEQVVRALENE